MFLIVDNESTNGPEAGGTALLLDVLRELYCDYEVLKSDAAVGPGGFEPFAGIILSDCALGHREGVSLSRFRLNFQALVSASVPTLGVGTGARIIAEAHGAVVQHRDRHEDHEASVELLNQSVMFDFLPEKIRVRDDRPDFIAEVPPHFELAAKSERRPVLALQHRTKELYAMHFGIAAAGDAGKTMVKNFLRYAGTAGGVL